MLPFAGFRNDAKALPRAAFVGRHGDLFLVKKPSEVKDWEEDIQFETVFVMVPEDSEYEDGVRFDASWRAVPVRKREGNPFPDRISVGRAQNCDVVLRLSYVSKLHAHFLIGPKGIMHLCDQRSANGTRLNGEPLLPGTRARVKIGDTIGFGKLDVQLVNGAQFHALLRKPR